MTLQLRKHPDCDCPKTAYQRTKEGEEYEAVDYDRPCDRCLLLHLLDRSAADTERIDWMEAHGTFGDWGLFDPYNNYPESWSYRDILDDAMESGVRRFSDEERGAIDAEAAAPVEGV